MFKKNLTIALILLFIISLAGCERKTIVRQLPKLDTMEDKINFAGLNFFTECTQQGGSKSKCIEYATTKTKEAIDQSGTKNVYYQECINEEEKEITCQAKANLEIEKIHKKIEEQISKF